MTDVSDTTTPNEQVQLNVSAGEGVPAYVVDYATGKLQHLVSHERSPVLFGEIRLTFEPNPARDRPATAEAVLVVNGDPVRAHVAAHGLPEAVDLLEDRLARRLERHRRRGTDRARRRNRQRQSRRCVQWRDFRRPRQFGQEGQEVRRRARPQGNW